MEPIEIPTKLAGNPSEPQYAVSIKTNQGQELRCVDPRATRAMVALMDMQAVMGGAASHWGGPSAFADVMSALHAIVFTESQAKGVPWHEAYHLVNDAGHCENGLYALKAAYGYADLNMESLKGFRSIQSPLTGHGESHLFPEGVYLSNGPLGSSLGQAQGLAFADRLAGNDRLTVTAISDGACMEGEAKEALVAIPGLASKGRMNPFVLIVSDNNTKLTGRIDEQTFDMTPSFTSLKELGWNYIRLDQAHDLKACAETLQQAFQMARENPKQPVVIHAKTIKGYGVKSTEESASGGHGFPLKAPAELAGFLSEIYQGDSVPAEFTEWANQMVEQAASKKPSSSNSDIPNEKVQVGVAEALSECVAEGYPVFSISSDLPGSTGTGGFQKAHPENSYDIGVAESNMMSMAAGLSKSGFIPIVDTFAQFGVTKGALPLTMASLSQAPMIAFFSHIGFQDAADGASHQSLGYFAMTSAIPNVETYCLTTSGEAKALVKQAVQRFAEDRKGGRTPKSYVFFLGRENFPRRILPESYRYKLGQAQVLFDNSKNFDKSVVLAGTGPLSHQALLAAKQLESQSIGSVVINPSVVSHPDLQTFGLALAQTQGRMVTVEEHQENAGFGAQLTHKLLTSGQGLKVRSLAVKGEFGQSAYKAIELYEKHGLDSAAIVAAAKSLLA
ncbi:MAG: transketolase [Bdellovibrionaceae bacterium]|nr:transketolase [Pseudobdellovibrionaceae bacterium]